MRAAGPGTGTLKDLKALGRFRSNIPSTIEGTKMSPLSSLESLSLTVPSRTVLSIFILYCTPSPPIFVSNFILQRLKDAKTLINPPFNSKSCWLVSNTTLDLRWHLTRRFDSIDKFHVGFMHRILHMHTR